MSWISDAQRAEFVCESILFVIACRSLEMETQSVAQSSVEQTRHTFIRGAVDSKSFPFPFLRFAG